LKEAHSLSRNETEIGLRRINLLKKPLHSNTYSFDFDYWASLYQNDPEGFEREREKFVNDYIEYVGHGSKRLRGMQFRIDMERRRSKNLMGACIRLSGLMMYQFHEAFLPAIQHHFGPT